MDIFALLDELGTSYLTEGHKHCRPGWVNMPCCWCEGNPGYHLGWNLEKEYFYCWRCGFHPTINTLMELSNLPRPQIIKLMREHGGRPKTHHKLTRAPRAKSFKYPTGTIDLQERHKQYLATRDFDPEKLEREWGLLGTGPCAQLDGIDYKHRIIIPVKWQGEVVSFQGRDITGRSSMKYRACPKSREIIHHKRVLYGDQNSWGGTGICVEGVTDVWRLGNSAFATFGIIYKTAQLRLMVEAFQKIAVLFDDDPQAVRQAKKLVAELRLAGVKAWREEVVGDPGSLSQDDADKLVEEIGRRK